MRCPNCDFENHLEDAKFCQQCGIYLINLCTNQRCDLNNGEESPLPDDAKFCPYCGSETSFNKAGFFDSE